MRRVLARSGPAAWRLMYVATKFIKAGMKPRISRKQTKSLHRNAQRLTKSVRKKFARHVNRADRVIGVYGVASYGWSSMKNRQR